MTTLSPPNVKKAPSDSVESKVYSLVETFKDYIPVPNDRNRLSYCLFKYLNGEGDNPKVVLQSAKIGIKGISSADLAKKLEEGLNNIK
jgi:hypothetical protein